MWGFFFPRFFWTLMGRKFGQIFFIVYYKLIINKYSSKISKYTHPFKIYNKIITF